MLLYQYHQKYVVIVVKHKMLFLFVNAHKHIKIVLMIHYKLEHFKNKLNVKIVININM